MASVRNDALVGSEPTALAVSKAHLHRCIEHYQQLRLACLADSEPSQRRMASVYLALEQERRALLRATEEGCPERCLDYLDAVSEVRSP